MALGLRTVKTYILPKVKPGKVTDLVKKLKSLNCFLFSSLSFIIIYLHPNIFLVFLWESDCVFTCTTIEKNNKARLKQLKVSCSAY